MDDKIKLRTLQEDWAILKKFAISNKYPKIDKDFFENYKNKKFRLRIIDKSQKSIGFLIWKKMNKDVYFDEEYIYLDVIFIDKKFRGKGFGEEAFICFEDFIKKKNFKIIAFGVEKDNLPAISLYRKLGYNEMKVNDNKYYGFYKFL